MNIPAGSVKTFFKLEGGIVNNHNAVEHFKIFMGALTNHGLFIKTQNDESILNRS